MNKCTHKIQKLTNCNEEISKENTKKHEDMSKENEKESSDISYTCPKCNSTCNRKYDFLVHLKSCKGTKSAFRCLELDCKKGFNLKKSLVHHLRQDHGKDIKEPLRLNFPDFVSFTNWKKEEEKRTYSIFKKRNLNKNGHMYFYCEYDNEYDRPTKTIKTTSSAKTGLCIAMMHLSTNEDGTFKVVYFPTHSHPMKSEDCTNKPQKIDTPQSIVRQIAMGVPPSKIIKHIKESTGVVRRKCLTKASLISKNRLETRVFFDRKKKSLICDDDDSLEEITDDEYPGEMIFHKLLGHQPSLQRSLMRKIQNNTEWSLSDDDIQSDNNESSKNNETLEKIQNNFDFIIKLIESDSLPGHAINMVFSSFSNILKRCEASTKIPEKENIRKIIQQRVNFIHR